MHVSQVCMGPVPWGPVFNLQTLETFHDPFQSHTRYWEPWRNLRNLKSFKLPVEPNTIIFVSVWDQSHTYLSCLYGTCPMFCYMTPMGPVP